LGVLLIANTLVTYMTIEEQREHSTGEGGNPGWGTDITGKLTTAPTLPSLAYCERLYGNLTTRPENLKIKSDDVVPPLLLSYPGSGNTYLRAVLEYATSLHSGSVYKGDKELLRIFPRENLCSRELGLIKGHPPDFIIFEEMDSRNAIMASKKGDKRKRLRLGSRDLRIKCLRGLVKFWSRVIFLARDPFASILSDSQRQLSGSHTGTVPRPGLNSTLRRFGGKGLTDLWLDRAIILAKEYDKTFSTVIEPLLNSSNVEQNHGVSIMYVAHFEKIVKDTNGRVAELARLMRTVYPTVNVTLEKLECSFLLADSRTGIMRQGVRKLPSSAMYSDIDPDLPCRMFPYIAGFSSAFNYTASPNLKFESVAQQCNSKPNTSTLS